MRKTWLATLTAVAVLSLPAFRAEAVFLPWVGDLHLPNGDVISSVNGFDFQSDGYGFATNFPTAPAVGDIFDFTYQSVVVAVNDAGGNAISGVTNLNPTTSGVGTFGGNDFQITVVAKFQERIVDVLAGPNSFSAYFEPVVNDQNSFSIYYDDSSLGNTLANQKTGVGLADGLEIASGQLIAGVSDFTAFFATLQGSGNLDSGFDLIAGILGTIGLYDDTVFVGPLLSSILVTGQVNAPHPAGGTPATGNLWHTGDLITHDPVTGAVVLKIDGAARLGTIPEPGTMILLGSGLLGLAGTARRRQKKA